MYSVTAIEKEWCPVTDYTLFTITQYTIYIFFIITRSIYSLLKGAAVV